MMITRIPLDGRKEAQSIISFYHANAANRRKITAQGALNLPDWLQSHQYREPVGILPTAWSSVIHTNKHPYGWLADNPWALELAQANMRIQREGRPLFFNALEFEKRFAHNATSSTVLFVDVSGSTGPQSRTLRQRFPDLPGRVLLQDRPEVIERTKYTISVPIAAQRVCTFHGTHQCNGPSYVTLGNHTIAGPLRCF